MLTIQCEGFSLYRYNDRLRKHTKRKFWEVYKSPELSGFLFFEGWGYERKNGYALYCPTLEMLKERIIRALEKNGITEEETNETQIRFNVGVEELDESRFKERMALNFIEATSTKQSSEAAIFRFLTSRGSPQPLALPEMVRSCFIVNVDGGVIPDFIDEPKKEVVIDRGEAWGSW